MKIKSNNILEWIVFNKVPKTSSSYELGIKLTALAFRLKLENSYLHINHYNEII